MSGPTCITRRGFLGLGACLLASSCLPVDASAFTSKRSKGNEGHDEILESILFGTAGRLVIRRNERHRSAIDAINYASYLCIDQAGDDGKYQLENLNKFGVPHLPTLDDIRLPHNATGDHRKYTHKGWHYAYDSESDTYWKKRKNILLQTINTVFDFGLVDELKLMFGWFDNSTCDAFAKLVYCIHILGDYQEGINKAQEDMTYRLKSTVSDQCISYAHRNASEDNRDLLFDLNESLRLLFDNETTGKDYSKLASRLDVITRSARRIKTVEDEESAQDFQDNLTELRELLENRVPKLLEETSFFKQVFYQ